MPEIKIAWKPSCARRVSVPAPVTSWWNQGGKIAYRIWSCALVIYCINETIRERLYLWDYIWYLSNTQISSYVLKSKLGKPKVALQAFGEVKIASIGKTSLTYSCWTDVYFVLAESTAKKHSFRIGIVPVEARGGVVGRWLGWIVELIHVVGRFKTIGAIVRCYSAEARVYINQEWRSLRWGADWHFYSTEPVDCAVWGHCDSVGTVIVNLWIFYVLPLKRKLFCQYWQEEQR